MTSTKNNLKIEPNISLDFVTFSNEKFLKISNFDKMRPFFMSILSDSDHWMFISSNGGLTAGRKNAEFALFPYYTDDKITALAESTGSKTIIRIRKGQDTFLWEPFSIRNANHLATERNIYKNVINNKLIFEEILPELKLTFKYCWSNSKRFGFVKTAYLTNESTSSIEFEVLDGIQNILPYGVASELQQGSSNLVDAYKRSELEQVSGLGIFALSAIIVDKAEPSESLKANVVWSLNHSSSKILLSSQQLDAFRNNQSLKDEVDIKGEKGAYFVVKKIVLASNQTQSWKIIADVNKNHSQIVQLIHDIKNEKELDKNIEKDIEEGTLALQKLVGLADGLQTTNDKLQDARSYSNVLFNIMRGGIFDDEYNVDSQDFIAYIHKANVRLKQQHESFLKNLTAKQTYNELKATIHKTNDIDLLRLTYEYLPLKFSRRHGDPSRPWNKFSINLIDENTGKTILDYQGNWRDIFQNWEALAFSFPNFIEGMIFRFLNASTFEGYNPYRLTKNGFDWETIEPDDPWSYIGYWGDHQVIYLLKFLEFMEHYKPQQLATFFDKDYFVFASVPYIYKSYDQIVANPKDTISFNVALDKQIRKNRATLGTDMALLHGPNQEIYHVNLIEKLAVMLLAKVANFIPEGGIWLNTQRPEWNDANNALVGNGVSMVTLYYLRRFLIFFQKVLNNNSLKEVPISEELHTFLKQITDTLTTNHALLSKGITNRDRKNIVDSLGQAASDYRMKIYEKGFAGNKQKLSFDDLRTFVNLTLSYIEHSIQKNKRTDGLYHSYNIMSYSEEGILITHLDEMLEGQVAVLSSGFLDENNVLDLLDSLKKSALFRHDQYSYILYPNKELAGFLSKNKLPNDLAESSALIKKWVADGNKSIVEKDREGNYHFNGNFRNVNDLLLALEKLESETVNEIERKKLTEMFELVFNHKTFTGRSGTFFAYEGLGSIYWHMVSKLQLAVQECIVMASRNSQNKATIGRLIEHYFEIKAGIGLHKSPELYGAFSTDPYSHTPLHKGAQQPGMTGQVKEDVISRLAELGVMVQDGLLSFRPLLLKKSEFLSETSQARFYDQNKQALTFDLKPNQLFFTYCHLPIFYELSEKQGITLTTSQDQTVVFEGNSLDAFWSEAVFQRSPTIKFLKVGILPHQILND